MCRIVIFSLMALGLAATAAISAPLVAPIYPDAVAVSPHRPGHFLTKDSFEQVKAFYTSQKGSPTSTDTHPVNGENVFYEYMDVREVHKYDPVGSAIGVRIYKTKARSGHGEPETSLPVVGDIFGKLKLLTMQGSLTAAEYNEVVRGYEHLATWHFPLEEDSSGHMRPMAEAITERCQTSPAEADATEDMEAMAMKAQQLMMQGRQREALELLQRVGERSQGVHESSMGAEGVQKWQRCLQELQENGYPTKIEIALDPSRS